jgi:hypothetical protein
MCQDKLKANVTAQGKCPHTAEYEDPNFEHPTPLVAGLVAGVFGTRAWMAELGRKGGSVTSEAKASAVRENGKKGGRLRKVG